jgi:hypothetical protein
MYGSIADFVSTRPDIIANQPNFNKMQVRNGRLAPGLQPTLAGEDEKEINRVYGPPAPRAPMRMQLPQADMQRQMQPNVSPVAKAADDFLEDYLTTRGGGGESVVADNSDFSAETRDAIRALLDQQRESLMREPMLRARPRMLEARPMMTELEIDPMTGGMRSRNVSSPFGYGPLPSAPVYREPANREPFSDATPEFRDTLRRLGVIQ